MATKKQTSGNRARKTDNLASPQMPEDYLALDNIRAEKDMPKELKAEQTRRVSIHVPNKDFDPKIVKSRQTGVWDLELPEGTGLGLPGRKGGRMSAAEVVRGIKGRAVDRNNYEPFRPEWIDYTPHPKVSTAMKPLLRRIDGRPIEPYYGVFGADDRQVYYPSGYPWSCVGKILVWNDFSQPYPAWTGSGVLIGGRVVLTVGHMAPWGSNNWAMQFIPAFYDGGSTLGAGVSSWVSDYWGYNTGNTVSAWDMLVLRLYTPLGNTYGYFGTKDYNSSWQGGNYWTLAGYPAAVAGANRPSRQMWWPVLDDDSDGSAEEVEFEADATPGHGAGLSLGSGVACHMRSPLSVEDRRLRFCGGHSRTPM